MSAMFPAPFVKVKQAPPGYSRLSAPWEGRVHTEPSAEPPGFTVTVTEGTVTVVLSGEFDVTTEGFLSSRLAYVYGERPRRLTFDMARVTYIDCASARLIAGTGAWVPPGVKPVIACAGPIVRRVFQVSGLDARCELEPCGRR